MKQCLPIIACRKLLLSEKLVGTLGTNTSSYLTVEPDIAEVRSLLTWVSENIDAIREANATERIVPQKPSEPIITLDQNTSVPASTKKKEAQRSKLKGRLLIPDVHQSIPYCECPDCENILVADMGEEVPCDHCSMRKTAVPRCKILVCFVRREGNVQATMYDKQAAKLLRTTPEVLHKMASEEVKKMLRTINENFLKKTVLAELEPAINKHANQTVRYNVHAWAEENEVALSAIRAKETMIQHTEIPVTVTGNTSSAARTDADSLGENDAPGKTAKNNDSATTMPQSNTDATATTEKPRATQLAKTPEKRVHDALNSTKQQKVESSADNQSTLSANTPEKHETKKLKLPSHEASTNQDAKTGEVPNKLVDPKLLAKVKLEAGTHN